MRNGIVVAVILAAVPVAATPCDEYFAAQSRVKNTLLHGAIDDTRDNPTTAASWKAAHDAKLLAAEQAHASIKGIDMSIVLDTLAEAQGSLFAASVLAKDDRLQSLISKAHFEVETAYDAALEVACHAQSTVKTDP